MFNVLVSTCRELAVIHERQPSAGWQVQSYGKMPVPTNCSGCFFSTRVRSLNFLICIACEARAKALFLQFDNNTHFYT